METPGTSTRGIGGRPVRGDPEVGQDLSEQIVNRATRRIRAEMAASVEIRIRSAALEWILQAQRDHDPRVVQGCASDIAREVAILVVADVPGRNLDRLAGVFIDLGLDVVVRPLSGR